VTKENKLSEEICDVSRESVMNFYLFHYGEDACKSFSELVELWELIGQKLKDSINYQIKVPCNVLKINKP